MQRIQNYEVEKKQAILINHSNHPFETWDEKQKEAAKVWGVVEDMLFPNVSPKATSKQVYKLADKNLKLITGKTKDYTVTVHVMGELTYTNHIVGKMTGLGISCIASTTERIVSIGEDGSKTSTFKFVAFRPY